MATKLAQLLTTARALPPTPFRASGPQLTDAIEGMASRGFNMPAKSDVRDVEAKPLSSYEEERVQRAIAALGRLREGEALREVSTSVHPVWAGRREGRSKLRVAEEARSWGSWKREEMASTRARDPQTLAWLLAVRTGLPGVTGKGGGRGPPANHVGSESHVRLGHPPPCLPSSDRLPRTTFLDWSPASGLHGVAGNR